MKSMVIAVACLLAVAGCGKSDSDYRSANNERTRAGTTPRDADTRSADNDANNTGVNTRDRDGVLPTPVDQSSSETDLGNVTAIRKQLTDSDLSTDAKNVKVVSDKGRVTLRGPVRSAEERDSVVRIARDVAGIANVDDLIDIVAAK